MLEPNFKVTVKDLAENSARITIEPLPQNFGHTLGNSLRRVLLTSLEGGAATQVKIDGVSHQFSTISGMKEDVLEFILNLKSVNFAVDSDEPVTIKIHATGVKEVKASDFDLPASVTVSNPDQVLAHLTNAKAKLSATVTVAKGMGYVSSEEHMSNEIGVIPLDSSFSPVVRANYTVEATRVGSHANYDKIKLQITTDGTVTPLEAFKSATHILNSFLSYFSTEEAFTPGVKTKLSIQTAGFVDDLDLPTRVLNALKKAGYVKLSDLKTLSLADLKKVKNLGEKSALQVVEKAKEKGITIA